MTRGVASLIPAFVLAVALVTGCRAEPEPPLRIGTVFWPSSELLFLAQEYGWLNDREFLVSEGFFSGTAASVYYFGIVWFLLFSAAIFANVVFRRPQG